MGMTFLTPQYQIYKKVMAEYGFLRAVYLYFQLARKAGTQSCDMGFEVKRILRASVVMRYSAYKMYSPHWMFYTFYCCCKSIMISKIIMKTDLKKLMTIK